MRDVPGLLLGEVNGTKEEPLKIDLRCWDAVKELKLSSHNPEAMLFTIYPIMVT